MSGLELALGLPGIADMVLKLCRVVIERCRKVRANELACMQLALRVRRFQDVLEQHRWTMSCEDDTLPPESQASVEKALREIQLLLEKKAVPLLDKANQRPAKSSRVNSVTFWMRGVKDGDKLDGQLRDVARAVNNVVLDLTFSLAASMHVQMFVDHDVVMRKLGDIRGRFAILEQILAENKAAPIAIGRIQQIVEESNKSLVKSLAVESDPVSTPTDSKISRSDSDARRPKSRKRRDSSSKSNPRSRPMSKPVAHVNSRVVSASAGRYVLGGAKPDADGENDYVQLVKRRAFLQKELGSVIATLRKSGEPKEDKDAAEILMESLLEPWRIAHDQLRYWLSQGRPQNIGVGGFGDVYRGIFTDGAGREHPIAIKVLSHPYTTPDQRDDFIREVTLLFDLEHPCVIRFMGATLPDVKSVSNMHSWFLEDSTNDENKIGKSYARDPRIVSDNVTAIVTELMHCNLHDARTKRFVSWDIHVAKRVLLDVAESMRYLHSRHVVHLDLKPRNVMINVRHGKIAGRAKITDFGVSQTKRDTRSRTMTHAVGTRDYMAPEMMRANRKPQCESDVWSYGVLVCELLSQVSFIGTMQDEDIVYAARLHKLHLKFSRIANAIPDARMQDIVQMCLLDDPKRRVDFSEICLVMRAGLHDEYLGNFIGDRWRSSSNAEASDDTIAADEGAMTPIHSNFASKSSEGHDISGMSSGRSMAGEFLSNLAAIIAAIALFLIIHQSIRMKMVLNNVI
eukprot:Plantae.Rhodophyta-Hildenbrandia_rubra.ctg8180.p1 GENE.Plantae.Rhodophyta-Hildenbrandia_rubra.ctg8180~~Plantae.Rhodophyta-Hildenbrandia_rubra.ctg8180.p1  ORF type:complete len:740 (+),score=101.16 Plantae.Rhodophyta-Hildenbrandia_rubra.ctg8180:2822-5041(+)